MKGRGAGVAPLLFGGQHNPHLDLARGLAAVMVLLGHLRAFLIIDFKENVDPLSFLESGFYFVTGLAQQAVMVFFVLSGFFISRAIHQAEVRGEWGWAGYALDRLSRLWVVLIPALLLTLMWDSIGGAFSGSPFYRGEMYEVVHTGPKYQPVALDALTFLGNLAFLNTILVESYGSSAQLWSLANEFWYYVLFPLWLFGLRDRRGGLLAVAALLTLALPFNILFPFPVWLMGSGLYALHRRAWGRRIAASRFFLPGAALLFIVAVTASRLHLLPFLVDDYVVGLATTLLLWGILSLTPTTGERYGRFANWLSRISYTLYLCHLSLIAALFSIALEGERVVLSAGSFALFVALLLLVLGYATVVYNLFERHTGRVRAWLHTRMPTRMPT